MKASTIILIFALSLSPATAQFCWDDEPASDSVLDQFNTALRTPAIEPLESAHFPTFDPAPVTPPAAAPVFQSFVAPVLDVDPLVEQCNPEPEVAQVYRATEIADDDADCPEYLGRLSANPYAAESTANPYSPAGSPYVSTSVDNRTALTAARFRRPVSAILTQPMLPRSLPKTAPISGS